jgi:hypothetical protein
VREQKDEPRTDEISALSLATDPPSRWSVAAGGLDVFWPILAVILTIAVIFVAVVARSSMDEVGAPAAVTSRSIPTVTSSTPATIMIVQVSSHPSRTKAEAAAATLTQRGFTVQILKSDDYRPLNSGFWVVYAGPFPATAAGRTQAKKIQLSLTGSLVRTIHHR